MKTNKLDHSVQEKLANRTFKPSTSAWERLSVKLDDQPKENNSRWVFYMGAVASILLLVSIGIQLFSETSEEIVPKNKLVIEQMDKNLMDTIVDKVHIKNPIEEAIVHMDTLEKGQNVHENRISIQEKPLINYGAEKIVLSFSVNEKNDSQDEEKAKNIILIKDDSIHKEPSKQDPHSRIKINSEDLLYAVTHSKEEVKAYYAKYNINRDQVLQSIQNQLNKTNLSIDANAILAEVERDIDEDDFQNNFMKSLKKRVSDIASAIASRND
jgi:negative regulator of sigma E activity